MPKLELFPGNFAEKCRKGRPGAGKRGTNRRKSRLPVKNIEIKKVRCVKIVIRFVKNHKEDIMSISDISSLFTFAEASACSSTV